MGLDQEIEEYLRPLFGDMAPIAIETQKQRLSISEDHCDKDQYIAVADSIKLMCEDMAGEVIAQKIHSGLIEIIEQQFT